MASIPNNREEKRPDPDPSTLTTDQLQREIANLKELLASDAKVIDARLDAMDRAVTLLQNATDKSPSTSEVAASVTSLRDLHTERFHGVETQFKEKATAVDAAFAASKELGITQNKSTTEAINKSNEGFEKQIDTITTLIGNSALNANDKFESVKSDINKIEHRLTAIDGRSRGHGESWGMIIGAAGIAAAAATVITLVIKIAS